MNTLTRHFRCESRTDALTYQRNIALLGFGKAMIDLLTITLGTEVSARLVSLAWLNPFVLVGPWMNGHVPTITCLSTLVLFAGLAWNTVHRLRDAGYAHGLVVLVALPFIAPAVAIVACLLPSKRRSVWDLI